ncbi:MerR family transcriptional regulator [Arthrobacter sp. A5]|uniref:MerR family transcriptional regulator n=1 Tax=Arthrobacter sp. A5 TaxID=576926 RepID=UPI003DA9CBD8
MKAHDSVHTRAARTILTAGAGATGSDWPISDVARMSRVSSRTLRHYDAIGLLTPARTDPSGHRHYGPAELRRLQRILLLRGLGLALDTIAAVLAGETDELEALRTQHGWLLAERDRMARMAATVDSTINALRRGETMNANELFTGFEENPYEEEAIARWGKDAVGRSNAKYAALSADAKQGMADESAAINADLARYQRAGLAADDDAVQTVVGRHYRWVCFHWTPNAQQYVGLGRMYIDEPRFRAAYETAGVDTQFLLEAITAYAAGNLA